MSSTPFGTVVFRLMGNHENQLLKLASLVEIGLSRRVDTPTIVDAVMDIGQGMSSEWFADWVAIDANHSKLAALVTLLESIPHVIAVRGDGLNYNVVHAELSKAGIDTDNALDALHENKKEADSLLWSSDLITERLEMHTEVTST